MIEPTSTSKGSDHVTLREFESWQKSQAEIATLRQQLVEEARRGLERLTDERFRALIRATVVNAITDKSRPATAQGA